MDRDNPVEVLNYQKIENDSSASGNLNGRDDSDNTVTVPEETNENNERDEKEDEGHSGVFYIWLKAKLDNM